MTTGLPRHLRRDRDESAVPHACAAASVRTSVDASSASPPNRCGRADDSGSSRIAICRTKSVLNASFGSVRTVVQNARLQDRRGDSFRSRGHAHETGQAHRQSRLRQSQGGGGDVSRRSHHRRAGRSAVRGRSRCEHARVFASTASRSIRRSWTGADAAQARRLHLLDQGSRDTSCTTCCRRDSGCARRSCRPSDDSIAIRAACC